MTTFVDAVEISGVKAINDPIKLDLRSSLVVLYAPNGTGKTSIWSAISAVIADLRDSQLQCVVEGAKPLQVRASLRTNSGRYTAIRSGSNRLRLDSVASGPITGTEALKVIAPECSLEGMQAKGSAVQTRLQEHIRSTRALPADSLAYLIDDSDDSIALRRQIFGDLTGTSGLQVEQRELNAYINRLTASRDERNREKTKRVADHNTQKAAASIEAVDSKDLLIEAASHLNIQISGVNESEILASVRSAYSSRLASLESQRKHIEDLQEIIASRDISLSIDSLASDLAPLVEGIHAVESELRENSVAKQIRSNDLSVMKARSIKLDGLSAYLDSHIGNILSQLESDQLVSIADVKQRVSNGSRELTASAISSIERAISDTDKLQSIFDDELKLATRSAEVIDAMSRIGDINHFKEELLRLDAQIEAQTQNRARLEKLRITLADAAQQILSIHPSNTCPCCSHQWPSEASLNQAIDAIAAQNASDGDQVIGMQEIRRALIEKIGALTILQRELSQLIASTASLAQAKNEVQARVSAIAQSAIHAQDFQSRLSNERHNLQLHDLMDVLLDAYPDVDMNAPLAALTDDVRSYKRKTVSDLLDAQTKLDLLGNNEQRLRALLEENRSAARLTEKKIADAKLLEVKRNELGRALGIDINSPGAFQALQSSFSLEDRTLRNVGELLKQASDSLGSARARKLAEEMFADIQSIQNNIDKINDELDQAKQLLGFISSNETEIGRKFFNQLGPAIATLFNHMQVNRIFQEININMAQQSFSLSGSLDRAPPLSPENFSQGQRQDLALAMFLARACTLGGSYFLDEPLLHLDDLNRTALLDCIRACVIGTRDTTTPVQLLITTANWSVARQFIQKFSNVKSNSSIPALTIYGLTGNVNVGVKCDTLFTSDSAPQTMQ